MPTPYFKLQTPAKPLSKSNITFNSQSKFNHSQLSLSKSQDYIASSSEKVSNDSSEYSALINAKNIGLDGEVLNSRRSGRGRSLVQTFQQSKMKMASLNQLLNRSLFSRLKSKGKSGSRGMARQKR